MSVIGGDDTQYPAVKRRLRLGIVGGGRGGLVGHWHASGARLSNRWQFVAGAMSSKPEVARASAEDWMIDPSRAYGDYRDMAVKEAARPDGIEAVLICTPNDNHFAAASAFLEAGIDVILDKPMTTALDDSLALLALKRRQGLFLGMTYPYAFHAMVRQARHMIKAGAIGEVRQALVEYVQEWGAAADPAVPGVAWRLDPKRVGRASATGDIGTHAFHLLHYVLGQPIAKARADFHVCGPAKPMEDTAFISLKLATGAPGHMWITQVAPGNYCGLRFRVFGDKGGIEWDQEFPEQLRVNYLGQPEQVIVRGHGSGVLPSVARMVHLPRGHGEALTDAWGNLYTELALAVEARRGHRQLPEGYLELPTAEDGVRGMKFIDACADSHEAGGVWKDCWIDP